MNAPLDSDPDLQARLAAMASGSSRFSQRQLLALRKELLLTRAAIERAELVDSVDTMRGELRGFGWIGLLARRHGLEFLTGRLATRIHPIAGTAASLVLGSLRANGKLGSATRLLRTAAIGMATFEALKTWRRLRSRKREARARRDAR